MNTPASILILVGSLRAQSSNRGLAELAIAAAPHDVALTVFDGLGALPHYNEDIDTPDCRIDAVTALRQTVTAADAVLVITPEYNGTIPGVLKNAIDWLSRPYGSGALLDTPTAVVGTAMGQYGGTWAHDDARKALRIAGARVLDAVTVSIPAETLAPGDATTGEVSGRLRDAVAALVAEIQTTTVDSVSRG